MARNSRAPVAGWVLDVKEGAGMLLPGAPMPCPLCDTSVDVVLSLAPLPLKMGTS